MQLWHSYCLVRMEMWIGLTNSKNVNRKTRTGRTNTRTIVIHQNILLGRCAENPKQPVEGFSRQLE